MRKINKSKFVLFLALLSSFNYQSKAITGNDVRTVGKPVNNLMSRLAAYKLCFGDSNYKYFWLIPAIGVPIGIAYCADYIDRKNARNIFAEYLKKSLYISDDYNLSSMISDINYIKNKFNFYFESKSDNFTDNEIDLDFNCDKDSITKYKITKGKINFDLKDIKSVIGENNFFDKIISCRNRIFQKLNKISKQTYFYNYCDYYYSHYKYCHDYCSHHKFINYKWDLFIDNYKPDMPFHVKICRIYDNKEKSKTKLSVVFSVSFDIKTFTMAPMPNVKYKVCFKLADKDKLELQIDDRSYGYY